MPMPFYQELAAFSNTVTSQEGSVSGCTAPLGFGRSDVFGMDDLFQLKLNLLSCQAFREPLTLTRLTQVGMGG